MIRQKYSCYVYGEGAKDKAFLQTLISLEKFQYHTRKWVFQYDNASGNSPKIVLEKCHRECSALGFNLILCFIDLDKLKSDFPKNWEKEKNKLEKKYPGIKIIWQMDNAEDEYKKVLGSIGKTGQGKHQLNKLAKKEIEKFINSEFWKRILEPIRSKEKELDNQDEYLLGT